MELTLEQLEKETCSSYGGVNCVLHQCMFYCVLEKDKKDAMKVVNTHIKGKDIVINVDGK